MIPILLVLVGLTIGVMLGDWLLALAAACAGWWLYKRYSTKRIALIPRHWTGNGPWRVFR